MLERRQEGLLTPNAIAKAFMKGRRDNTPLVNIMGTASFILPLQDLGDGEVNLVLQRGAGDPTFTRATVASCRASNGLLKKVASGVPRSHYLGTGLRTNRCLYSEEFDNTFWAKAQVGTGVTPVVVANDALSPTGTLTADKVTLDRGAGNTAGDSSTISTTSVAANLSSAIIGATYYGSVWVKGTAGQDIAFRTVGAGPYLVHTFSGNWERIGRSETAAISRAYLEVATRGSISVTNKIVFWIWGAQVESGSVLTDYIPTAAAAVTALTSNSYAGYLAEGARTNLCIQSEDLTTSWTNTRSNDTANAIAAPDGTTTADKLYDDATAATTHIMQVPQATITSGATQTVSGFFKAGERTWIVLSCSDATLTNFFGAYFDLTNGSAGSDHTNGAGTVASKSVEDWGNGWYRCVVTGAVNGGVTSAGIRLYLAEADNDNIYSGDGASGLYCWGMQHEEASFASSYIPTTTASVTRNRDTLSYAFAGNASVGEGTAYAELVIFAPINGGDNTHFLASGTAAQIIYLNQTDARTVVRIFDGTNGTNKAGLTDLSTGVRKRAASWGAAGLSITGDGAAVATTASFDGAMGPGSAIEVGHVNAGNQPFGTLKNVRIWTRQLSDQVLQNLTQ